MFGLLVQDIVIGGGLAQERVLLAESFGEWIFSLVFLALGLMLTEWGLDAGDTDLERVFYNWGLRDVE